MRTVATTGMTGCCSSSSGASTTAALSTPIATENRAPVQASFASSLDSNYSSSSFEELTLVDDLTTPPDAIEPGGYLKVVSTECMLQISMTVIHSWRCKAAAADWHTFMCTSTIGRLQHKVLSSIFAKCWVLSADAKVNKLESVQLAYRFYTWRARAAYSMQALVSTLELIRHLRAQRLSMLLPFFWLALADAKFSKLYLATLVSTWKHSQMGGNMEFASTLPSSRNRHVKPGACCPSCGMYFATPMACRKHQARKHTEDGAKISSSTFDPVPINPSLLFHNLQLSSIESSGNMSAQEEDDGELTQAIGLSLAESEQHTSLTAQEDDQFSQAVTLSLASIPPAQNRFIRDPSIRQQLQYRVQERFSECCRETVVMQAAAIAVKEALQWWRQLRAFGQLYQFIIKRGAVSLITAWRKQTTRPPTSEGHKMLSRCTVCRQTFDTPMQRRKHQIKKHQTCERPSHYRVLSLVR